MRKIKEFNPAMSLVIIKIPLLDGKPPNSLLVCQNEGSDGYPKSRLLGDRTVSPKKRSYRDSTKIFQIRKVYGKTI